MVMYLIPASLAPNTASFKLKSLRSQMAVGHDARVRDQRPVRLAVDHRADHNDGGGVQRELRAEVLFHIGTSLQKLF